MGGLRSASIPQTHLVFLIGVLAIAGVPPLSGLLLEGRDPGGHVDGGVTCRATSGSTGDRPGVTAAITAFYMFRLHYLTFYGESRVPGEERDHIHEPRAG